jgi:hypothetical protein
MHWKEHLQAELSKIPNINPEQIETQSMLENAHLHRFYSKTIYIISQEESVMEMRHRIEELESRQNTETMTDV